MKRLVRILELVNVPLTRSRFVARYEEEFHLELSKSARYSEFAEKCITCAVTSFSVSIN